MIYGFAAVLSLVNANIAQRNDVARYLHLSRLDTPKMNIYLLRRLITFFVALTVIFVSKIAYSEATTPPQSPSNEVSFEAAMAFIYIIGVFIQQLIEFLDPIIVIVTEKTKTCFVGKFGKQQPEANFKKSVIFLFSFCIAFLICLIGEINILDWLPKTDGKAISRLDFFGYIITAFVLSSGTESVNIAQKYFGYIKEGKKNKTDVTVKIDPEKPSIDKGLTILFAATIENSENIKVDWKVVEGNSGGSIDVNGLYTAPNNPGTYHVRVYSQADTHKFATTTVTVK
jgi:uncharacterized Tic20 family protein